MENKYLDPDFTSAPEDIQVPYQRTAVPAGWDKTLTTVADMQSGKMPDDVVQELKRRSAESSATKGLGIGRTARDLSFRDLGVSTIDMMQKGAALGLEAGNIEGQWNIQQAQLDQQALFTGIEARQRQQELNQKWAAQLETLRLGEGELAMNTAKMMSANKEARLAAELDLVKLSASTGMDVQKYMDAIGGASAPGYFEQSDKYLQSLMDRMNYKV